MANQPKLTIVLDSDRIEKEVTVDELIAVTEDGSLRATRNLVGRFVWNKELNTYYPNDVGTKMVGKLSIGELKEITDGLLQQVEEALVPKASSEASE